MAFKWLKRKPTPADAPAEHTGERPAADQAGPAPEPPAPTSPADEPAADAPAVAAAAPPAAKASGGGLFARLKRGLSKTRAILNTDIEDLFRRRNQFDEEMQEDLEELLITADIGVQTAMDLIARIAKQASRIKSAAALKAALQEAILDLIAAAPPPETAAPAATPHVIMVVGVNGVGKTTTIGKLAARHARAGRKVLIAAADTFRAAAIEQLTIWAERAGADIVKHHDQADPAAVAFDAVTAALARRADVVLIDTAGRLHTKVNLMEELKKVKRTVAKKMPGAPHETLLVLDATTGQNALSQAKLFDEALELDSLALTKLDGTAKGGIVVGICSALKVPLKYVGVGEQIDDLQDFDPSAFVKALF
jgi:fused signal recognition particle receptor